MNIDSSSQPILTVAAAAMMTTVLGSIHAFSVFVPEWELLQGSDRATVSLVYSVALISLTSVVLFGYLLFAKISSSMVFMVSGMGAAAGLIMSAYSESVLSLYVFYGVVFGSANGLGYGYALQLSGQAMPSRKGMAMGVVTAFYAVGATAFPVMFTLLIARGGNSLALIVMAAVIIAVSCIAATMVKLSRARFHSESSASKLSISIIQRKARLLFWVSYGAGATAGLMVIGHAYSIAMWSGLNSRSATTTVILLSFGSMLGGFGAGYISDRIPSRVSLFLLPTVTGVALLVVYIFGANNLPVVWISIAIIGFCYGALIAVYPVAVSDVFGSRAAPRIYGQVFTAWGVAGLLGPWSSGWFFVHTNSYNLALLLAIVLCVISAGVTRYFPIIDGNSQLKADHYQNRKAAS